MITSFILKCVSANKLLQKLPLLQIVEFVVSRLTATTKHEWEGTLRAARIHYQNYRNEKEAIQATYRQLKTQRSRLTHLEVYVACAYARIEFLKK